MNAPQAPDQAAPAWFHNGVVSGLQFLWALGLPGTPAAELATMTASAWVHALWHHPWRWDEEADSKRLREAFTTLAARVDRWPAPRAVLEAMPPRRRPPALTYAPEPQPAHVREFIARKTRRATKPAQEAPQ